jgi:hypothetical protein
MLQLGLYFLLVIEVCKFSVDYLITLIIAYN